MAEQLLSPEFIQPRHIVSYFDHEFAPSLSLEQALADIHEMKDSGFTHMVLCVTEQDIASEERQEYVSEVARLATQNDLDVWADPWSVGGVFGGEGQSEFRHNGETRCYCNPHVDALLTKWIDVVSRSGIQAVFWDEPEMHCSDHRNDEVKFLAHYTALASDKGLENIVCMCANESRLDDIQAVAHLPGVAEIATDPYFPNAFTHIGEEGRLEYVERWAHRTREIGKAAGKRSHVWVQGFDVPEGKEAMIGEHVAVLRSAQIADIALWGFGGCQSIPNFARIGQASPSVVWQSAKAAMSEAKV